MQRQNILRTELHYCTQYLYSEPKTKQTKPASLTYSLHTPNLFKHIIFMALKNKEKGGCVWAYPHREEASLFTC